MSKHWTKKQDQAIASRGKTLLISAAAGSGKTATLTERILRKLTDPDSAASIDRMLIVTYTRMSAADLKRKISDAISERLAEHPDDEHLSRQLVLLENSHICTIDSFYLEIVRAGAQRLGIPSGFRIADEGEMALLRREVMDSIIEKHYDARGSDDPSFLSFIEGFTSAKQSDTLSDIFLSLESKLCSRIEREGIILTCANELRADSERDFFKSRQGMVIRSHMLSGSRSYFEAMSFACDTIAVNEKAAAAYLAIFAHERDLLGKMVEKLESGSYSELREMMLSYNKSKLSPLKKEFQTPDILLCKSIRDEVSKFIKDSSEKYFSFTDAEIRDSMLKTSEVLSSLHTILSEFESRVLEEKIKRRVFDFNDIRTFAFRLLCTEDGKASDLAISYRDRFDEIYIDEYQDVDAVQDKIFTLISRPDNRFMVGDIKQSIYSFRGADPEVFSGYKKSFPQFEDAEGKDEALIFMSNNFRCDRSIIDLTNEIFSFLFGHCGASIGYAPEDDLIFSKISEGEESSQKKVQIALIADTGAKDADEEEDDDDSSDTDEYPNAEAMWIAKEIKRLISGEKRADGSPIEPSDIAIIMRSVNPAADISRALGMLGIPCSDNSKYDLFETPDVLLVLSLLSAIDNPHKDIPLAATLYSPLFAYDMDDLIKIRSSADSSASLFEAMCAYGSSEDADPEISAKNEYFIKKLTLYRERSLSMPIDKLLNMIMTDLSIPALAGTDGQNLTRLYEMARRFESGSFKGLNNFISYINELIENKKVPSLTRDDPERNCVQLITAHKSKGLEFPVCFICNTDKSFNSDDIKPNLLYHPKAGIALKLSAEGGMARVNTPMREAVALAISESQIEEEMRILYVALTRARERLYISGRTSSSADKLIDKAEITSAFASDFSIKRCKSWLSMILAALYPASGDDCYDLNVYSNDPQEMLSTPIRSASEASQLSREISEETLSQIQKRLISRYPYEHLSKIPAKLSVSQLTPTVIDDLYDDCATLADPDDLQILEIEEYFDSRRASSSAARGTATHLFLQFCDLENAERAGADAELARLTERGFISPRIAEMIDLEHIKMFFSSDLYSSIRSAKRIWREQRFNIMLPVSEFTEDPELIRDTSDERILIQGVIDLLFETDDGRIILCDYKTDRLSTAEMRNERLAKEKLSRRHAQQLSYYALATQELLGKKPDSMLVYSLPLGKAIEIDM